MKNQYHLSAEQANLIKDILKVIGRDDGLTKEFASSFGLSISKFNKLADDAFDNLGNRRVEVITS